MISLSSQFRAELATEMRDSLLRIFGAMVLIYGVFFVVNMSNEPGWRAQGIDGTPVLVMDAAMPFGIAALVIWLWRNRQPAIESIDLVCAVFIAVAMANAVVSSLVLSSPRELFYIGFFIIGAGAVLLDRRVILGSAVVGSGFAMAVAIARFQLDDILWTGTCVVSSSLFAVIVSASRRNMLARIDDQRVQLAAAVNEAKDALSERIRVEEERAALEQQLMRSQKLDALGTLAGGIAHDMNNVLAAITAVAASAAEDHAEGAPIRADLDHILAASERGAELTRNLLGFARRGKRRSGMFDLRTAATQVGELLQRTGPKRIRFELDVPDEPCVVKGDADQVGHAVMNLALNAVDSIGGRGIVTLRCRRQTLGPGEHQLLAAADYCCLEVADTGGGMSQETLERAFEPFYSTKGAAGNSGLGLSMVYGTVIDHGGAIDLDSATGRGTVVTVLLPRAAEAMPATAPTASRKPHFGGVILVVDDEPLVRRSVGRIFGAKDIEHVVVDSGQAALDRLEELGGSIVAVVLDLAMPGMSGGETLSRMREAGHDVPVLIASGYPKDDDVEALLAQGRVDFIAKPYRPDSLLAALENLVSVAPARAATG